MSSLAGVTIYIYEDTFWIGEPVIGEIHVLGDNKTRLHYAGSGSRFRDISFWLLNQGNFNTIQTKFKGGDTVTLVDWLGTSYSVKIRSLNILDTLMDIKRPSSNYTVLRCRARLQEQ